MIEMELVSNLFILKWAQIISIGFVQQRVPAGLP